MTHFAEFIFENKDLNSDKAAIIDQNGERSTSWRELYDNARRVAVLAGKRKMSGLIPVCMERSMEAAATLLGLSLAGVGVAPLSVGTPAERQKIIAEQAENAVWTKEDYDLTAAEDPEQFRPVEHFAEPAYVVYTSGSTGVPKGVMLSDYALISAFRRDAGPDSLDISPSDIVLQMGAMSFIALIVDLFSPLSAGATVHILPESHRGDPERIKNYIDAHGITTLISPPQLLRRISGADSLRVVCVGTDRVSNIGPNGYRLFNAYGMSETLGPCMHYRIMAPMEQTPIGVPGDGVHCYVLDEQDSIAEEGELCISGPISSGYYRRPDLTEKAFVPNPFAAQDGCATLLHTGDIVRRLPDGDLLYLNRKDNMIKINGQRVEPGEAENVLMRIEGVRNAVVKGFTETDGRSWLCAYYVADREIPDEKLRSEMKKYLSSYMIPAFYVRMDSLPVNANGKLDRKALLPPDAARMQSAYESASNETEEKLCKAFEKLLKLDRVGVNDDFFRLGGDSITAMTLVQETAISSLTVSDVMTGRTPKGIAVLAAEKGDCLWDNLPQNLSSAPLTESQMGIYLECMMRPESTMYNIPLHLVIPGRPGLTAEAVKAAVDAVLSAHPALLAHVRADGEKLYMERSPMPQGGICKIAELTDPKSPSGSDSKTDACASGASASEILTSAFIRPFDLSSGPLCRAEVTATGNKITLLLDTHHIVSDGTSVSLLCRQICAKLAGEEIVPETVDAFALAEAEKREAENGRLEQAKAYYDSLISGLDIDSNLLPDFSAADRNNMPAASEAGAAASSTEQSAAQADSSASGAMQNDVSKEKCPSKRKECNLRTADIASALKGTELTESTVFLAAFGYALAKMTGQPESLFAAAESGRKNPLLNETVSMMVKTIPVVMRLNENDPPRALLENLQKQFFESVRNDVCPFGTLAREYGLRSDVMFVYQGTMLSDFDSPLGHIAVSIPETGSAVSNLSVSVRKFPSAQAGDKEVLYDLTVDYRSDLYKPATIRRFTRILTEAVKAFTANTPLSAIALADQDDLALMDSFNRTTCPYNREETIIDLFRQAAAARPESTCVVYKDRSWSYAEADKLTDCLAAELCSRGIGKGSVVSVLIPRCEYMVLASLGVMKAGAMYQPLDPSYPPERLQFMCGDASASLVIADRDLISSRLPDYKGPVLFTDEIPALLTSNPVQVPALPAPDDGYILLYTSGTTGTPKGCKLLHRNLTDFVHAYGELLEMDENCRSGCYASYGFDAHMGDIYPALAAGGAVYVIPEELRLNLPALKDYMESSGITHMVLTTQLGRQFAVEYPEVKHLRAIVTGGEKLVSFTPHNSYRVINGYGPTECTIAVTFFDVDRLYDNIPIGRALANTRLYVVDACGRRVPVGVPGELVASGPQVSAGYLNRPEQTAKVFVPNTFEPDPGEDYLPCYRTGDIVRILEDGNLEFLGRRDHQVKIRGFRIELGEVERVIRDYPGITDATVIAVDENGGKSVHAYIVSKDTVDISALNAFIRARKPSYMVPAATMQIPAIPLNANLKVDKRKLPPIPRTAAAGKKGDVSRSRTELEKNLFEIIKEITGTDEFDVETELTEVGLTSISSIKLSVQLYKRFGINIPSKDLLDGGSVLSLENTIVSSLLNSQTGTAAEKAASDNKATREGSNAGARIGSGETAAKKRLKSYPLTQTQMGIYLDSMRTGNDAYNIPVLLRLPEGTDTEKLKKAVKTAVLMHPSMLCSIFPDENGDVSAFPRPDMPVEVTEETVSAIPPEPTHFAFEDAPLFRFRLITCDGARYLMMEAHHIIADGESMSLLLSDLDQICRGETPETEQYTAYDLSVDEQGARTEAALEKAKVEYDGIFRGVSADYLPAADRTGDARRFNMNRLLQVPAESVKAFCRACKVSENTLFTGIFALTVARYTAHEDALFATIHNGRGDPRTERLFSMLVKTLPVYVQAEGDTDTGDWLRGLEELLRKLKKYDIYSFADAARDYGVNADLIFIYQGRMMSGVTLDGKPLEVVECENGKPKAELSAEIYETEDSYRLCIEYNGGRYSEDWMNSFADAFRTCLGSVLTARRLRDVDILSPQAKDRYASFNDTDWPVPYRPVYRLLEDSAEKVPDRPALIAAGETLTYRQLDNMASAMAQLLLKKGVTAGSAVEILTGRTKEFFIAQQGILKAGSAFLYVSPAYPDDRIGFITADSDAKAIITTHALAKEREDLLKLLNIPVLYADDIDPNVTASSPEPAVDPDATAYMIYTSGSTGKPKGVIVHQAGLVNLVHNNPKNEQIAAYISGTAVVSVSAFTFDASVFEAFTVFANGTTLCVAGEEEIHNPVAFTEFCLTNKVTSLTATPSFYLSLLDAPESEKIFRQLKTLIAGGEAFPKSLYEHLRGVNPDLCIINAYGPSEATVCTSARILNSGDNITLGRPITNIKNYTVDSYNHILPMGALGELVVLGVGVGKGYMNRSDLTQKSFITLDGLPAYKTGDLAVVTHEEEIEYHGRIDNQVKLRGLRVELGEIESAITGCPGVKNCVVTVNGDERNRFLAGYYTADGPITPEEITAQISKTLTEYMVPRILMRLDALPLTANGKVDRRALPKPEGPAEKNEYVAPANATEEALCGVFAKALGMEKVGVTDDFFALGGTSLTATKVAMFALAHNISIVYGDIFKYPTVRELAALAAQANPAPETAAAGTEKPAASEKAGKASAPVSADAANEEQNRKQTGKNTGKHTEKNIPASSETIPWNYTAVDAVLASNVWNPGDDPGHRPLGNILLTGANGFLGMHVLKHFLDTRKGDVYCLLRRGSSTSAEMKLLGMYIYYFDESIEDLIGTRIHCIDGDITDKATVDALRDVPFDTLFNCAACVKHFANDDVLDRVNVYGVENLAELCLQTHRRLIHVSTVSVAGESVNGTPAPDALLYENMLYFGQTLENRYIASKFRSERVVLDAVSRGLDAKIMRAGNLMPRRSDGEFQINYLTNGFMRRLHGYYAIGCIPYSAMAAEFEFSPIDETAATMIALAETDSRLTVFHTNNTHHIFQSDVIRAMNGEGLRVDPVSEAEFSTRLMAALEDPDKSPAVSGLIAYLNRDNTGARAMLGYDNFFTRSILDRIGSFWNITDDAYMRNALHQLREMGFFDLNL